MLSKLPKEQKFGYFNPELAVNWLLYLIEKLATALILWEKH